MTAPVTNHPWSYFQSHSAITEFFLSEDECNSMEYTQPHLIMNAKCSQVVAWMFPPPTPLSDMQSPHLSEEKTNQYRYVDIFHVFMTGNGRGTTYKPNEITFFSKIYIKKDKDVFKFFSSPYPYKFFLDCVNIAWHPLLCLQALKV